MFDSHAMPVGNECHSLVLKGRKDYANTAFVMPRAILGVDENGEKLMGWINLDEGSSLPASEHRFELRLGIYFPFDKQEIEIAPGHKKSCGHEQILNDLKDEGITKVSNLAIVDAMLTIDEDELSSKSDNIAVEGTSVSNYLGMTRILKVKIKGQKNLDNFIKKLQMKTGIEVDINFILELRQQDGTYECELDTEQIINELQAGVGFAVPEIMTKFDIEAAVSNTLQKGEGSCYLEASTSADWNKAAENITNTIFDAVLSSGSGSEPGSNKTPTSNPATKYPLCAKYIQLWEKDKSNQKNHETMNKCLCKTYGQACDASSSSGADASSGDSAIDKLTPVKVDLVYKFLREKKAFKIRQDRVGVGIEESYNTSFLLKTDVQADSFTSKKTSSGEKSGTVLASNLKRGDQLIIKPLSKESFKLHKTEAKDYYSKVQLDNMFLHSKFEKLSEDTYQLVKEKNSIAYINSSDLHGSYWSLFRTLSSPKKYFMKFTDRKEYRFGDIRTETEYLSQGARDVEILELDDISYQGLDIALSFEKNFNTKLGISQLLNNSSSSWELSFDKEKRAMILTAKEDLGAVRIFNTESFSTEDIYSVIYFEETIDNDVALSSNDYKIMSDVIRDPSDKETLPSGKSTYGFNVQVLNSQVKTSELNMMNIVVEDPNGLSGQEEN